MKKIYLLLCICFFAYTTKAQNEISPDYNFNVSEPYQVYDAAKKYYFSKNSEILAVKPWKKYLVIQKFGVDGLDLLSEKKYEDLPDNYVVEGMIELQDKYYFFYSSWSGKKTKQERLYYREIDFNTGEFIGESIKLINVSGKLAGSPMATYTSGGGFTVGGFGMSFGGFGVVDKFDFLTSKDESKLLVQYRKKPEVKRDTKSYDIIGVNVFDVSLNALWSKDYKMPYTERRMDLLDFAVDANGHGYILTKVFHDDSNKDKKKRKDKDANYHMELFRLLDGSEGIEKSKIVLNDKFINGISLFESPDGDMICAGFYTNGLNNNLGNSDGIFTFKITKEGKLVEKTAHEIPVEVLNQYVSKRTQKKNAKKDKDDKAEFANLRLRDLVINTDGSLILIGEQTYVVAHYRNNGQVYYTFHNNDMLLTKVDASGNLAWMKKLPKRQSGAPKMGQVYDTSKTYQGGMSYSYFYTNGNHYMVYLDNVKNIDLKLDEVPAKHSDGHGGYLTAYKINDATGTVTKDNILDTRNVTDKLEVYQFSNNRVVKTAENQFVIEFYKKKKEDVLIKVEIK
ncbi:hypothetical protein KO494_01595 [Lacinutrix sp. C3R15]|uniref:hypothetical protein n=1 Tax=Flavobacteriaceae TaxID=49546 RepID=UPI001C0A55F5|nr:MULTISPECIES: hypothetical protein [Flavobacteriaceae]MBU2938222.1 hypothetical protein [Lacinutrix sp. C3R15]MDO6621536.1 hypothetical protein [Oceanihabitans sp. 1_MG-2023]